MVEQAVLLKKVGELQRYVEHVRRLANTKPEELAADEDRHDLMAFRLLLAVQNAIDLALHLVASRGESVPGSYREAFEILARARALDPALASQLAETAALRNRIAQLYGSVDWERLLAELPEHLLALERFAAVVAAMA
jgi:uncharacterized protein YutE (UPF0331/DUF86 family)